jgi:hypothetical protein
MATACTDAPQDGAAVTGASDPTSGHAASALNEPAWSTSGSGRLQLVAPGSISLSGVTELTAQVDVMNAHPAPSTQFVAVATIVPQTVAYSVDGKADCARDFATDTAATCTGRDPGSEMPKASDFAQVVTAHSGMSCAPFYDRGSVWQKSFDVALEAAPEALAAVKQVVYDIHSDYRGNPFTVATSTDGFSTATGYLTPGTSWPTGKATVYLVDGTQLEIAATTVRWTDDDADHPANGKCNEATASGNDAPTTSATSGTASASTGQGGGKA